MRLPVLSRKARLAAIAAVVAVPAVALPIAFAGRDSGLPGTGGANDGSAYAFPATPDQIPDTPVRVNQVGYLPDGPKRATVISDAQQPLRWELKDKAGKVVASGASEPRGMDDSSGQNTHVVDFSSYRGTGNTYTLEVDGKASLPFDLDPKAYQQLGIDSLSFFYPQRSGIEISNDIAPGYGRKAGHTADTPNGGDTKVPCAPGSCDYTLDVTGGWYDAGDHGKYVVNGGISVAQLMSSYERSPKAAQARALHIPETGGKTPDVLDEARWELDFLLKMQVPDGEQLAGMAHHKIHDVAWTGLPTDPAADPQQRQLRPPSTAATLNLAAAAAQGARVFAQYDKAYSEKLLGAAKKAYAAAKAHPTMYAPDSDGVGGGAYGDANVSDEFYWAAAELYITTGDKQYAGDVSDSTVHKADVFDRAFDWQNTAALGRLDLATIDNKLPDRERVRESVVAGADRYLKIVSEQAYGQAYAPNGGYDWASNAQMLNNLAVVAAAFDLTGEHKYRDGVLSGMDYLFGRNALNQSYVTGYGEKASKNQHSRWYAHQLDPKLPNPPRGTLAGGPNSQLQDEVASAQLRGCKPQMCYIDDIKSWSTNELTINWNSALAYVSTFVADQT
ncbi:glycoside hydrolase family 9 protein [Dactylosporangium roseum]|uniref:glycoside hydrolase family 9 protein n=1 Tax=Dactylosporangium roseum TaxID=47989 RepID=UPI0028C384F7|nr:glycoside hydrolase family 9 protein [Dactylosporangium roseum]